MSSFGIAWFKDFDNGRMLNQLTIYQATIWVNKNLPDDSMIGAFNAGIAGYYSDYPVINLDGLVNNVVLDSMLRYELWDYINEQGISHFTDGGYYFLKSYYPFLGIEDPLSEMNELANFPIPGVTKAGSVSVFELLK